MTSFQIVQLVESVGLSLLEGRESRYWQPILWPLIYNISVARVKLIRTEYPSFVTQPNVNFTF